MENDVFRLELFGGFESAEGELVGAFAVVEPLVGELEGIGSIDHDLDGRGEVVMHSDAAEFAFFECGFDAGILGNGHAVGELDVVEAELDNFIDHCFAIGVARVVPAGGKAEHDARMNVGRRVKRELWMEGKGESDAMSGLEKIRLTFHGGETLLVATSPAMLRVILFSLLACTCAVAEIVITEIHHSPDDKTSESEFIEMRNVGVISVDLSGWAIADGVGFSFPSGAELAAGEVLLVAENAAALRATFTIPADVEVYEYDGFLSGTGERVRLINATGAVVDEVEYSDEFPWPVRASGDGPSMELVNPWLDNDLGGSWRASDGDPSPGAAQNTQHLDNAPPQMRQVDHSPQVPTSQDKIEVSVKATDPDGIGAMTLRYQIVVAGDYIPATLPWSHSTLLGAPQGEQPVNPAFEDPANWTEVAMTVDAQDSDRYVGVIPAQPHRTLVRYRIIATDGEGASRRAPEIDDPSRNFAAFVYDGVPDYTAAISSHPDGAGKVYTADLLTQLPVYQLITRADDLQAAYAYDGTPFSGNKIPKGNRAARKIFNWQCAFFYDGVVYDHVRYRLRQNNNRYSAGGKRSMRFRFNDGHYFQARDEDGKKWPVKWRTLNFGKMSSFNSATTYGLREVVNSMIWRRVGVECPYFYHMHLRVIDDAVEAPDQWTGDFFGLGMAFEDIDGRLLDARGLPDGNVYKWKDGERDPLQMQKAQGRYSVSDGRDFSDYRANLNAHRSISELEDMVDWQQWSRYHAVCEAIRHYDFGTANSHQKNQAWYFIANGESQYGRLRVIPHDHDASWGRGYHDSIRIGIGRDFPWRAIFSQSDEVGAADDRSPLKPPFNLIYRNTVRDFRDLFWQEETVFALIDQTVARIEAFSYADRDRWLGGPVEAGEENAMGEPEQIARSMKSIAFTEDFIDGASFAGGRAAFLDQLQTDINVPLTPVVSYVEDESFSPGSLVFAVTDFADPQGGGDYAQTEWRVAEVSPSAPQTVIGNVFFTGASWSYYDLGSEPVGDWTGGAYNPQEWGVGSSPLGYNENGLATTISFGGNADNKHLVAYFRREFTLDAINPDHEYRLRVLKDDGAAIYINGSLVSRLNLPSGELTNTTAAASNAPEGVYDEVVLPTSVFRQGVNVIAVSLHQRSRTSSDTKLDIILDEMSPPAPIPTELEWDNEWTVSASSNGNISLPAAVTRTGRTYRVRARHHDVTGRVSHWSAPVQFTAGEADVSSYTNALVIAEMLIDPAPATAAERAAGYEDSDFEFIALRNISGVEIDLRGVRFTKGIDFDFDGVLAAGADVIVARNPQAYAFRYGGDQPLGPYEGKLKNEGERLKLSFGAGEPIRDFSYFDSTAWPSSDDGTHFSLALADAGANPSHGDALSWRPRLSGESPAFDGVATDDLDGDGVPRAIEYLIGTSDGVFDLSDVVEIGDDSGVSIDVRADYAGLRWRLIESQDLASWSAVPSARVLRSNVMQGGRWQLDFAKPGGDRKRFFVLEAVVD